MELKLYEIAAELRQLADAEEWDDAAVDALAIAFEQKASGIIAISEQMDIFAAYCKAEEERIRTRRQAVENRIASMKRYLQQCMEQAGVMKLDIGTKKLALQANPPRVVIDAEDLLPAKFIKIVQTQSVDKTAIKDAIKAGEIVQGAHLEQSLGLRVR
jgi:hypothetical protein